MRIWQSQPPSWLHSLPNGSPATLRVSVRTDSNKNADHKPKNANVLCRERVYKSTVHIHWATEAGLGYLSRWNARTRDGLALTRGRHPRPSSSTLILDPHPRPSSSTLIL